MGQSAAKRSNSTGVEFSGLEPDDRRDFGRLTQRLGGGGDVHAAGRITRHIGNRVSSDANQSDRP